MRKVTGKKKDVENGDGEEVEAVESEEETNGVDEDDPLATEDNDEPAAEENGDDDEEDEKPLKSAGKKSAKKVVKKPAKKIGGAKRGRKPKAETAPEEEENDDEEEYEVEDIVEHKYVKGVLMYRIRWKGWSEEDDTWEAKSSLSCPDIIKKYESENDVSESSGATLGRGRPKKGGKRKLAKDSGKPAKKPRTELSDEEDEEKEYEVARIINVTVKKNGNREFLVHWKGWSSRFDSWEPEENLNCEDLIAKFDKELSKQKNIPQKELRIAPKVTKRLLPKNVNAGARQSKRASTKERVTYFEQD